MEFSNHAKIPISKFQVTNNSQIQEKFQWSKKIKKGRCGAISLSSRRGTQYKIRLSAIAEIDLAQLQYLMNLLY
jgi:hypothetical protein